MRIRSLTDRSVKFCRYDPARQLEQLPFALLQFLIFTFPIMH